MRAIVPVSLALCGIFVVAQTTIRSTADGSISDSTVAPTQQPAGAQRFQAGVGLEEITPPPGLATGGHGPAGAVARGHLTRLYARAVFLSDGDHPLLLVSVEAFAVAPVFRSEIQKRLRRELGLRVPLDAIIVAATHTHHGPGNFLSATVYNQQGSRLPGYVSKLREFLVDRIGSAAVTAAREAMSSGEARIDLRHGTLTARALRNRSPETFMLNRDAAEIMDHLSPGLSVSGADCKRAQLPGEQDGGWDMEGCPRLRAVDRSLTVLDVWKRERRIAAIVFAAAHPTVLPPDTPLYSSDFAGLAMRRLEKAQGEGFVAAFFNGAEGDVATRRIRRDLHDLWLHASELREAVDTASETEQLDLTRGIETRMHVAKAGEVLDGSRPVALASKPRAGAAAIGGGEGDRTILYELGWRERVTADRADDQQGTKLNALDSNLLRVLPDLTFVLAKSWDFPLALPLGYARLGPLDIFSAPTEMSTATGYRIRHNIKTDKPSILIGLANEYGSYTATDDEYPRQDYMAASTLWGQMDGKFFERTLERLKKRETLPKGGEPVDDPGFGPLGKLKPYDVGARRMSVDEDLDLLLRNEHGNPVRDLPYFTWRECGSRDEYKDTSKRRVSIQTETGMTVDDDESGRLIVLLLERPEKESDWVTLWTAPLGTQLPAGKVRFFVKAADGIEHMSELFDPAMDKGNRGGTLKCGLFQPRS